MRCDVIPKQSNLSKDSASGRSAIYR